MRVVIMQPTYLPWLGYFDLMDTADCFVLLDTVQLMQGRSWQKRNRIKTFDGTQWLTVPVVHAQEQRIRDVVIQNDSDWAQKHWRAIEQNYRRAPFWAQVADSLAAFYTRRWERLAELNETLIVWLRDALGMGTRIVRASELAVNASREQLLLGICMTLGADTYLSPLGSAAYLRDDTEFLAEGIRVEFQHYEHPVYPQLYPPFVSHLSALDLLLNTGDAAREIARGGRRAPFSVQAAAALVAPPALTNDARTAAS